VPFRIELYEREDVAVGSGKIRVEAREDLFERTLLGAAAVFRFAGVTAVMVMAKLFDHEGIAWGLVPQRPFFEEPDLAIPDFKGIRREAFGPVLQRLMRHDVLQKVVLSSDSRFC
jgi:hypothetical protein